MALCAAAPMRAQAPQVELGSTHTELRGTGRLDPDRVLRYDEIHFCVPGPNALCVVTFDARGGRIVVGSGGALSEFPRTAEGVAQSTWLYNRWVQEYRLQDNAPLPDCAEGSGYPPEDVALTGCVNWSTHTRDRQGRPVTIDYRVTADSVFIAWPRDPADGPGEFRHYQDAATPRARRESVWVYRSVLDNLFGR